MPKELRPIANRRVQPLRKCARLQKGKRANLSIVQIARARWHWAYLRRVVRTLAIVEYMRERTKHHYGPNGKYHDEDKRRIARDLPLAEDEFREYALNGYPGPTAFFANTSCTWTTYFRSADSHFTPGEVEAIRSITASGSLLADDGQTVLMPLGDGNVVSFGSGMKAEVYVQMAMRYMIRSNPHKVYQRTPASQARELLSTELLPVVDCHNDVVLEHANGPSPLWSISRVYPLKLTRLFDKHTRRGYGVADLDKVAFRGASIKLTTSTLRHLFKCAEEFVPEGDKWGGVDPDSYIEYPAPAGRPWFTVAELFRLIAYHSHHSMTKLFISGIGFPDDNPHFLGYVRTFAGLKRREADLYQPVFHADRSGQPDRMVVEA